MYYNVSYARNIRLKDPFAPERGYATLADLGGRFVRNLARLPRLLGEAVSCSRGAWDRPFPYLGRVPLTLRPPAIAGVVFVLIISVLIVLGLAVQLKQRRWLIPLYVAIFVALVCATPWPSQFSRYLTPLAPVLVLCLLIGLTTVQAGLGRILPIRWKEASAGVFAIVLLPSILQASAGLYWLFRGSHHAIVRQGGDDRTPHRLFFYEPSYRDLDEALVSLKRNAMASEIVVATDPFWVYLNTGLRAVLPPLEKDAANAQRLLDGVPVRYLIVDQTNSVIRQGRYVEAVVETHQNAWRLVFSTLEGARRSINGWTHRASLWAADRAVVVEARRLALSTREPSR